MDNPVINMEKLIPIVNKLQDIFSSTGNKIDLPQIVVIGSQSCGKTSVLEGIIGKDFLPRGKGIVTRCPLILQLVNSQDEYGEFLHKPGIKFNSFEKIHDEIIDKTNDLTESSKGVSSVPIRLKIFSKSVTDLTLIDLPGITKIPIDDQPADIEHQINELCVNYIKNPNSLILAVSEANTDITNSDALKMARTYDPKGQRTLGVVTKLDLMDRGTDAFATLNGELVELKLGFIGVINKSQSELNTKVPFDLVRRREQTYFRNHPAYSTFANNMGISVLTHRLHEILLTKIKNTLPGIEKQVQKQLIDVSIELESIRSDDIETPTNMISVVSEYSEIFVRLIDGSHYLSDKLLSGAKINQIFSVELVDQLNSLNAFENLNDNDVKIAIKNGSGMHSNLFFAEGVFTDLIRRQIELFEPVCVNCVQSIFDEVQVALLESTTCADRFPKLKKVITDVSQEFLWDQLAPCVSAVQTFVSMEKAYINTKKLKNQINMRGNEMKEEIPSTQALYKDIMKKCLVDQEEDKELETIKKYINVYFDIIRDNLKEYIPKCIVFHLINRVKRLIRGRLIEYLHESGHSTKDLMAESDDLVSERVKLQTLKQQLESGCRLIQSFF